MMPDWIDRVAAQRQSGRPLALLFDYDGTLTPLVAHPKDALLPRVTRESLAALAAADGVTLGVISGRALAWLKANVGLSDIWYAGSNGMHIDLGYEERIDPTVEEFEPLVDPLREALSGPIRWFPGAWIERKPGCLTVHYRALLPLMAACFLDEVKDMLDGIRPDCPPLRVRTVSSAMEIALAASWTKGNAIEWMLERTAADAFTMFACDGANDEEAVAAVNARGGLTVGVGPESPADAALRVATTRDFTADLARLSAAFNAGHLAPIIRQPVS
jgi:trehalose 6-phosphate phosphatase